MKLSISNIAWTAPHDEEMYKFLSGNKVSGLEIAPTRIFSDAPYEKIAQAASYSKTLKECYNLSVSSIQSIWYGMAGTIFGSDADRQKLIDYTKRAVDFANALDCLNLVFGCPKNRNVPPNAAKEAYLPVAYKFFNEIGGYAASCGVCVSLEPNPPIYNTNFINTTPEAFDICKELGNAGIKVNMDLGAVIHNGENIKMLKDNISLINHVHISEPYLAPIEKRYLHKELIDGLKDVNYDKFISIEMSDPGNIDLVKQAVLYIKGFL